VLDARGLVLAGRLESDRHPADLLGALLNTAVTEASRTAAMLELGGWGGLLVDTERARLHLAPVADGAVVVLVAERDAPAGWVVRAAGRASALARAFLREVA
ncbi:MAG: roadblock/LC7 domain-containing protein, partial [Gemmatimonadota bacterium]